MAGSATTRFAQNTDPRAKIILALLFFTTILLIPAQQPLKLAACLVVVMMILLLTHIPPSLLFRYIIKIYPAILMISLIQLITASTVTGDMQVQEGLFVISAKWWMLIGFQVKSLLIICAGFIFIATTPFTRLISSFNRMHIPGRLVSVGFFAYHFIFILSRELDRIHTALRSRYIRLSVLKRVSLIHKVSIMYFMRLFDRSEGLNRLLLSRGFSGTFHFNASLVWQKTDSLLVVSGCLIMAAIYLNI
jgi:cobalt/nickel transport system permease protein